MRNATRSNTQRTSLLLASASLAGVAVLVPVFRLQGESWLEASVAAVIFVLPCVLLAWVVWRILLRRRDTGLTRRGIGGHLVTGLAFSALWTIPFIGYVYLMRPEDTMAFLRRAAVWQFVWGIVIYCAIAIAAHIQKRLKEQELAAAGSELQALRAQLNPHFLFNTLHSLTQLAREDPVATEEALERFGGLMRYVLNAGSSATAEVALEDEIGFMRDYLAVERLRLSDRLRVIEDIDPDALELAVPPLLLQPLVENAVRHGVAPRREGGTIQLTARLKGTMLAIEVADDGNGAEPDTWRKSKDWDCRSFAARLPRASATRRVGGHDRTGRGVQRANHRSRPHSGKSPVMTARLLVVDDEPLARRKLSALINEVHWATQVGEACDGASAVEAVARLRPDILLLDIQMPELSGIQVVERLRMIQPAPVVVFTTAFDQYAVTAFELEAVDYLLKPFGAQRFRAALERARQAVEAQGASAILDRARVALATPSYGRSA